MLFPNEEIDIGIDNSPYLDVTNIYDCYRARIQWRSTLPAGTLYKYGYGLALASVSHKPVFGISSESLWNK